VNPDNPPRIRKRVLGTDMPADDSSHALDLAACATFEYSSEDPNHRVENLLDDHRGPGGTYWSAARTNSTEKLVMTFDAPQQVSRLVYEVEERKAERTQEIRVEVSADNGVSYRGVLVQEYAFSPRGATFQREDIRLHASGITNMRFTIVPNKNGEGTATLVSLRLYP
jgi:hypothetical protein